MKTHRIGSLDVSVVGLGCNNFGSRIDAAATDTVVHAAIDAGINFFDTADVYGATKSEEFLGHALSGRRNRFIIATKFGWPINDQKKGARPEYIRRAVEDSLRRLRTDYLDLYFLHTPDPTVPIADTLGAMHDLVLAGQVREIGCSNFSAAQLREAHDAASRPDARFVSVQNEYSLLSRAAERDVLPEAERQGLAFVPYFPLANGLLTGKYRRGRPIPQGTRLTRAQFTGVLSEDAMRTVESLIAFAEGKGRSLIELAFGWLLARPVVASVIAGATSPEQVRQNAAAGGWQLSDADANEVRHIVESVGG